MSRSPFLQRRGFALNFRIAVPANLRPVLGLREVTKALPTTSRITGALLALQAAVVAKRVFADVQAGLLDMDKTKLADLMRSAREKLKLDNLKDEHEAELVAQQRLHQQELARARLEAENAALRRVLTGGAHSASARASPTAAIGHTLAPPLSTGAPIASPSASATAPSTTTPAPTVETTAAPPAIAPTLGEVVRDFLTRFRPDKAAMLKKHQAVLPLLLQVVGDKSIAELKQADIKRFLNLVQKLPPRWSDQCRKGGVDVVSLATQSHPTIMSPKTFDDTYKACLRAFLRDARAQWQDEGFPTTLTTDGVPYLGQRKAGENKQRPFDDHELDRLLNGPEMAAFAVDPKLEHRYWMVLLGFYTGARVNELCQINPQVDVLHEGKTGIWYVAIAEDSEADERIKKSVKNNPSKRKVPIHPNLVEMGFLRYAERMKAEGAKLLFPAFPPSRGRASSAGEKWFRTFLLELDLRDDTPGEKIVGMHAFRSTIMALAYNSQPPQDVTPITGHRGGTDPVVAGYQGELSLCNKLRILQAVQFGSAAQKAHLARRGAGDRKLYTTQL